MTQGRCNYCRGLYRKAGMTKHLAACEQRKAIDTTKKGQRKIYYHLIVEDRYSSDYWMHLKVLDEIILFDLDLFLKDVWVECCGHLSIFTIEGITYSSYGDSEFIDEDMDFRLCDILDAGMRFLYEYDLGSPTELILKVAGEMQEVAKGEPIQIMARNEAPIYECGICGAEATEICCECIYENEGWLCEKCAAEHECGEDMQLPVVNSPRVGICGYCGSSSTTDYSPA